MRTLAVVALAALLAACGDDDGGGGGDTSVALTGPLASTLSNGAYAGASGSCAAGEAGTVAFAGAFVAVSTAANQCSEALAGRDVANSTTMFLSVAKISLTAASTTLDAGTYPLLAGFPAVDPQGNARFSIIGVTRTGTSAGAGLGCEVIAEPFVTSGSVTITAVTASSISGSVTAAFDDGTSASGSFSVPTCGLSLSVDAASCELVGLPEPGTCTL